ncbi:hypothetical protein SERLA73DRAFT_128652, partial [Serpula lacrymans var. lacrymans S7.3]
KIENLLADNDSLLDICTSGTLATTFLNKSDQQQGAAKCEVIAENMWDGYQCELRIRGELHTLDFSIENSMDV